MTTQVCHKLFQPTSKPTQHHTCTTVTIFPSPPPSEAYLSNNHPHSQTSWPAPPRWACPCPGPACPAPPGSPVCRGAEILTQVIDWYIGRGRRSFYIYTICGAAGTLSYGVLVMPRLIVFLLLIMMDIYAGCHIQLTYTI